MEYRIIKKRNTGFTLLFASLIVSLLLAIGLSILEITFQQYTLSSAGRESQFAFYNADTGVECALYYDQKGSKIFATSSDSLNYYQDGSADNLNCRGVSANISNLQRNSTSATTTFSIVFDPSVCPSPNNGETILVKVIKYINGSGNQATTVQSRGYNTCNVANRLRVERGLQVDY